jgi:carbonic anhydrase/acetyltransferase-like protein (isoleucine patch superfamily)
LHRLDIGNDVVIGHGVVLHGCQVGDGALIGIGAKVLDGSLIEPGAQVGAGAVVAPGTVVPSGRLALGVPARVTRTLRAAEVAEIPAIVSRYMALKQSYRRTLGAGCKLIEDE